VEDLSQNVDLSKATQMTCDNCRNLTFKQTLMIHKMSALISPNGQETIIPTGVFACEQCGHVNEEFSKLTQ
jgi:uncharacterized Zn finger protein